MKKHLVCILDRSCSMVTFGDEALNSFNELIKKQKKKKGKKLLTLTIFDHEIKIIHKCKKLKDVPRLSKDVYFPRGMTALYDAIGNTLSTIDDSKKHKVLIVILTDGLENTSKKYNSEKIKNLLETGQNEKGWKILYLGADQDSFTISKQLGIKNSADYDASSKGIRQAFTTTEDFVN